MASAKKQMGQPKTRTGKAPMPKKGALKRASANNPPKLAPVKKAVAPKRGSAAMPKGSGPTPSYGGAMVRGSAGEGSY